MISADAPTYRSLGVISQVKQIATVTPLGLLLLLAGCSGLGTSSTGKRPASPTPVPSATSGPTATATATATAVPTASPTPTISGSSSVNIPTWHGDNGRSGLNAQETQLTHTNVNSTTFGKLFSYLVDGYLYAQPLYVSNLVVSGGSHNVVFVATENDSIYAFNADNYGNGSPLWKTSLLQAGETPQPGAGIMPVQGVTSTPVIDLNSNTMYVVSAQKGSANPFFRLHALDISTGQERSGSPVVVSATFQPASNSDAVNGVLTLPPSCMQRNALLLVNNTIVFGFSACHSGWLLAYDASSLTQVGVLNMSPNIDGYGTYGGAGGVWMGGGGPVADDLGNVYITTGNGPFDGNTAWGDTALKLNTTLQIQDYFTPSDFAALQCEDKDLAAGGALLIPGGNQLLVGGKSGHIILLNTGNMGHESANDAGAAQMLWFNNTEFTDNCTDTQTTPNTSLSNTVGNYAMYGTATWFNGSAYIGVTPGPVQRYSYGSGQLGVTGDETSDQIAGGSYGTTVFISANGNTGGIMWMLDHGTPIQGGATPTSAVLRAYDASNISHKLYDSSANVTDAPGYGIKFTSPIVANGKVFIGTAHDPVSASNPQGELDVYGLK